MNLRHNQRDNITSANFVSPTVCIPERLKSFCVLSKGCIPAPKAAGQADERHELHGGGQGLKGASLTPTDQKPADEGELIICS